MTSAVKVVLLRRLHLDRRVGGRLFWAGGTLAVASKDSRLKPLPPTIGPASSVLVHLRLRIPPVAVVMLAVGVMWGVKRAMPGLTFDLPGIWALAIAFALVGVAVAAFGVAQFVRAKTTVNPLKPGGVSALVTSGVYRFTRNPMYVGMLFILAGVALAFSHPAAFAVLPAFLIYMNRFQISPEEAALSRTFGPHYAAYRQRVRRWL